MELRPILIKLIDVPLKNPSNYSQKNLTNKLKGVHSHFHPEKEKNIMSHKFLFNASFHSLLNKIDLELADKEQQKGCSACGKSLHRSDYPRSPCGLPAALREHYEERLSFCCSECRKRTTPPSVRFFGRRWYPGPIFVLISALKSGINENRIGQIKEHLGVSVSESTWKRWRHWWRNLFEATFFWQQVKGMVAINIAPNVPFPRTLFVLYSDALEQKIISLLNFLKPLSIDFRSI
jgi:hypothetical protein